MVRTADGAPACGDVGLPCRASGSGWASSGVQAGDPSGAFAICSEQFCAASTAGNAVVRASPLPNCSARRTVCVTVSGSLGTGAKQGGAATICSEQFCVTAAACDAPGGATSPPVEPVRRTVCVTVSCGAGAGVTVGTLTPSRLVTSTKYRRPQSQDTTADALCRGSFAAADTGSA